MVVKRLGEIHEPGHCLIRGLPELEHHADEIAINRHWRGAEMHEVFRSRTSGDSHANLLVDDLCRPRGALKTSRRTQVIEEGGIPTRRWEVRMMLDDGFRLR
jgi:hypothetical protein